MFYLRQKFLTPFVYMYTQLFLTDPEKHLWHNFGAIQTTIGAIS